MKKNSIHSQITSGNPWFPSEYELEDYEAGDQPSTKFPVMAPEGWKPERCEHCEDILTGNNTKNFHYLAEAGYGDQKLCDGCLQELSSEAEFDRQREPSEGTNRGDWENRNYSSRQGSVHNQLTASNQRMSWGVEDAREGNDEAPKDELVEPVSNLPEVLMGYNNQNPADSPDSRDVLWDRMEAVGLTQVDPFFTDLIAFHDQVESDEARLEGSRDLLQGRLDQLAIFEENPEGRVPGQAPNTNV